MFCYRGLINPRAASVVSPAKCPPWIPSTRPPRRSPRCHSQKVKSSAFGKKIKSWRRLRPPCRRRRFTSKVFPCCVFFFLLLRICLQKARMPRRCPRSRRLWPSSRTSAMPAGPINISPMILRPGNIARRKPSSTPLILLRFVCFSLFFPQFSPFSIFLAIFPPFSLLFFDDFRDFFDFFDSCFCQC
jgi:hypothetical protein